MGAIKGVTLEDIENLKKTAIMATRAIAESKNLKIENQNLKETVENLKSKVPSIMDKIKENKEKAVLLEKAQAFDRLPDDVKRQLLRQKSKVQEKGRER